MTISVKVILIIMIITMTFFSCRKVLRDQRLLEKTVEGRKIRSERSELKLSTYITGKTYYKNEEWLFQRNRGIHPCDLKNAINIRHYSEGCAYIVEEKGM